MKQFIRYFLSIVFFLLAGFANTYANASSNDQALISNAALLHLTDANYLTQLNSQATTIKKSPSTTENRIFRVYAEETEEESHVVSFFKKQVDLLSNNYFSDRYAQIPECFHSYFTKRLPDTGEHFLFFSSTRYLVLQVIRI